MEDYYKILGVERSASQEEIKKAYKSAAMKHHPDRGGDETQFKLVTEAYNTLSSKHKKTEYDQLYQFTQFGINNEPGMFFWSTGHPNINFRHFRKNKDLNISCRISLLDSFTGKDVHVNFKLTNGNTHDVTITVPPGIKHGDTIRYVGLGDDAIPDVPRGNLHVSIIVEKHKLFSREQNDLVTTINITPIESMIGVEKTITHLNGQTKNIKIKPGVETGTEYALANEGFCDVNTKQVGRFVCRIHIKPIDVTNPALVKILSDLNKEIFGNTL